MSILIPSQRSDAPAGAFGQGVDSLIPGPSQRGNNLSTSWLQVAPPEVNDVDLWRQAWQLIDMHQPGDETAACTACGNHWPCEPYRRGQAEEVASRRRL